jgi:outer membrane protein OmpA-like peptidoglycan-associated protein
MQTKKMTVVAALAAVALIAAPGCVSKSMHKQHVEQEDARVSAVESGVEANERRISDLSDETDKKLSAVSDQARSAQQTGDQAMSTAEQAAKAANAAARGKLLWSVKLADGSVKFDTGKAMLTDQGKSALDDLIRKIKSYNKAVYLEIEGHTDSTGSESLNYDLGLSRADAVRTYLHQTGGIPLHAMNTVSYGESRPEADNSTREGRAQNRRVVVNVLE